MKKVLIISLLVSLVIFTLLILGYFYLKDTYVPKTLKVLIEDSVIKHTNLKIRIKSISYEILKGVVIEDISLFEEGQEPKDGPITVEQVRFNIMLFPSLEGKRIIIPTLYINGPSIKLQRGDKETWNIQEFLKKGTTEGKSKLPLVLSKIKVISGKVFVQDNAITPSINKEFRNFNLDINPGNLENIVFRLSSDVGSNLTSEGRIFAEGEINLKEQAITIKTETKDIELADIWRYFNMPNTNIKSFNLENMKANLDYSLSSKTLTISSDAQIENFDVDSLDISSRGKLKLSLNSSIESAFENPNISSLSGDVEFRDTEINGLKFLNSLKKIRAKFSIKDNYASLEEFEGLWQENKLKATAKIPLMPLQKNAGASPLTLDVYSEKLDTEELSIFLPEETLKTIEEISGKLNLRAHLEATMGQPAKLENKKFTVNAELFDLNLKLRALKNEISNINGSLILNETALNWKDINFSIYNQDFNTSGVVEDFNAPKLKFNVSSPLLNLRTQVSLNKENAEIENLSISSFDSTLIADGVVYFSEGEESRISLNTKIKLETSNLIHWLPQFEETLKQLGPKGNINLETQIQGPLLSFTDWALTLNAESESLKVARLNLDKLQLSYKQTNNIIKKLSFFGNLYGGNFKLKGKGEILPETFQLDLDVDIQNVDLAKLKSDTAFKDKDISGILSAKAILNAKRPIIETLSGEGELNIKEGKIWELKLLKGLGEILLLPEFSRINFNEGEATFRIADKRISTQDLTLASPQMNLAAEGWLGFDGMLNFDVYCEFSEEYIEHSADLRKLITNIFAEINKYLVVKVSGSLKQPEYKIMPKKLQLDILKPFKDIFGLP
ncbi:MAG: DUF748 domain-containing protein [Candidatus Omnitrophica bacterium]|nr:DUF748 domain-containing protein [Candidatus Omnitrophota bacterium]